MAGADGVDYQFAGQLKFFQAVFPAGGHDFMQLLACLRRFYFDRLFYQGHGSGGAGRDAEAASQAAVAVYHGGLLLLGDAHGIDLAAFHTEAAAFTYLAVHGCIKVGGPEFQRFGQVLVYSQHSAAASAA